MATAVIQRAKSILEMLADASLRISVGTTDITSATTSVVATGIDTVQAVIGSLEDDNAEAITLQVNPTSGTPGSIDITSVGSTGTTTVAWIAIGKGSLG